MTPISEEDMENFSLISTRNPQRHAALRKAWNKAFANSPLKDYEELMLLRARQLISTLKTICKEQGGVGCVDIAIRIGYFTYVSFTLDFLIPLYANALLGSISWVTWRESDSAS